MVKKILLQQKLEKERLLKDEFPVRREKLTGAEKQLETLLVKVISGPRRAGKSFFCHLLLQGKNYAYANFDDDILVKAPHEEVIQALFEIYGDPLFIFFDEIQNLPDWELMVNKLQRRKFNLIVTGSNARLLSRELATALTGRHIQIELLPFSFREYLVAKGRRFDSEKLILPEEKGKLLKALSDYLESGGFPEVVLGKTGAKTYLGTLFNSILLTDVVKRHNLRFSKLIYDLAVYLAANYAGSYTFHRLKNNLGFSSVLTAQNYVAYLEEAYLMFSLNRFSFKVGEQLKSPKKNYLPDTGFVTSSFQFLSNFGRLLENAVFLELKRCGWIPNLNMFYYKDAGNREVDFVLQEKRETSLIQVAYELNKEVEERELKALISAGKEVNARKLTVITWEIKKEMNLEGVKVIFLPFWDWVINREQI